MRLGGQRYRFPKDREWPIVDFFGHPIEVGDRYFYGNPPTAGIVIKLRTSSILIDAGVDYRERNVTMNCRSPELGICIDKVEQD